MFISTLDGNNRKIAVSLTITINEKSNGFTVLYESNTIMKDKEMVYYKGEKNLIIKDIEEFIKTQTDKKEE